MSNKELVVQAVQDMPDEATFAEILEQIAILAAIREGEEDADAGRVMSHEEIKKRISQWTTR